MIDETDEDFLDDFVFDSFSLALFTESDGGKDVHLVVNSMGFFHRRKQLIKLKKAIENTLKLSDKELEELEREFCKEKYPTMFPQLFKLKEEEKEEYGYEACSEDFEHEKRTY